MLFEKRCTPSPIALATRLSKLVESFAFFQLTDSSEEKKCRSLKCNSLNLKAKSGTKFFAYAGELCLRKPNCLLF
jgi:HJR/Mrr/RecB family endonuclease